MIGIANSYVFNYVPLGLIVPYYTAAAVPSGWAAFTSADGRYITGADSTDALYSIGVHAGSSSTATVTTSIAGTHTGDDADETVIYGIKTCSYPVPAQLCSWRRAATESAADEGDHDHTITYTPTLGYEQARLIKSTVINDKFPAGALVLSDSVLTPPSGVTQQIVVADEANNRFLKSNTSISTAYNTFSEACSTDGDHDHNWVQGTNDAFLRDAGAPAHRVIITGDPEAGDHAHTFTDSDMTESMYKIYLAAWTNAAADFQGFSKIIAMWESFTPPEGWVLCDGNNGTKNLAKRFVMFGPNASVGQYSGDGSITFNSTLDSNDFSHTHMNNENHWEEDQAGSYTHVNHDTTTFPHTHTVAAAAIDFLPNYYSLVFIQKL